MTEQVEEQKSNRQLLVAQHGTIVDLARQTNGLMEKLVKKERLEAEVIGKAEGKAEEKAEHAEV